MAKKKKLKLHDIHGSAKPMNGYTYLPVGFSELAEECKEMSRLKDADVAVVSAGSRTAAHDPSKLSHHIYRVGYHFRTDIFDAACNKLGYRERNGKLEKITGLEQPTRFEKTMSRYGSRFDLIDVNNRSQEESMKVKKHIRELFPKIPEVDLQEIYERAWEQGARTVGNANDLSLSRQVQLATIARIRHTYTDYDHLLRVGSWRDARTAVEHECLTKLIEWRGEHDQDDEELEEILRETIVIDDESDDSDAIESQDNDEGSDSSLEIVQHTLAPKDLRVDLDENRSRHKAPGTAKRTQGTFLPAALQARWQNARFEKYGSKPAQVGVVPDHHITVALDDNGMAPRTLHAGGMKYVRLSPEANIAPSHTQLPNIATLGFRPHENGRAVPYPHPPLKAGPHSPKERRGKDVLTRTVHTPEKTHHHGELANTAIHSIEEPYNAPSSRVSRPAYYDPSSVIDLTTPPQYKPSGAHVRTIAVDPRHEDPIRYSNVYAPERRDDLRYAPQQYPQAPANVKVSQPPVLTRHHDGMEFIDLTRSGDYSASLYDRPVHPDFGAMQHTQPRVAERIYRQPVYGQAAYPQMRSQQTPMPATPPRPVHGAPSTVQPVAPFSVRSPSRYSVARNDPAHRIPHK
ncbi:hypothetical protein AAFC00_005584 [Neodothiora populina]